MKLKEKTIQESYDSSLLLDWDLAPSRSSLKLFHAQTHLKDAQRDLIVRRIDAQRESVYNFCDWKQVQDNKRDLRRQFRTINKAVCDNKASTYRFNRKTKDLLSAQTLVENEIYQTEVEIEKYSETKEKMEKYVKMYSELFTSYLEMVAQKGSDFNSIQDILNRYEILENCGNECAQLLKTEMDGAIELKRKMTKLVEDKSSRLKNLHNSLVMLRVRRSKAAEVRQNWNYAVKNLENVIAGRLEESVAIQEGCYQFYRDICNKRKRKPIITKDDTKNQMHYITKTILFYKEVIQLAGALQQIQNQAGKRTENSTICRRSMVKSILNDLGKQSIDNQKSV